MDNRPDIPARKDKRRYMVFVPGRDYEDCISGAAYVYLEVFDSGRIPGGDVGFTAFELYLCQYAGGGYDDCKYLFVGMGF